jgi:16S rRNA (cytosine967-C5)-methyltransferase
LLLRLDPEVETEMAKRQRAIAAQAARLLRPGGRLVYAVCSPLRQEAVSVAEAVEAERPELRRVTENLPLDLRPDADGVLRLGPWLGDMDAYQVVVWEAVRPLDA